MPARAVSAGRCAGLPFVRPVSPGACARAAALGSAPKPKNYGEVYDGRDAATGGRELADTAEALAVHTDNPTASPSRLQQLLHCGAPTRAARAG